jgi:Aspartyl protease
MMRGIRKTLARTLTCMVLLTPRATARAQEVFEAPFEFVHNEILLEVRINGVGPLYMFLDTMGDPSVVDVEVARAAGLPLDTTQFGYATGVGGERVLVYASGIVALEAGAASFGNVDAIAMDLHPIGDRLGRPLAGILGISFLRDRIVQIDYLARVVRFFGKAANSPARHAVAPGWERYLAPLVLRGTDPLITGLRVNGRSLVVTIDTGSSLTLSINPNAIDLLGLRDVYTHAVPDSVRGARGVSTIRRAQVDSLGLGTLTIGNQQVTFAERPSDHGGSLGNGFLQHFVLTLDYRNNLISFDWKTSD